MSSLSVFQFESQEVRVILIDGEPWWVAKDVASALEYTEPARMLQLIEDCDKRVVNPQKLDSTILVESLPANSFRLSLINDTEVG